MCCIELFVTDRGVNRITIRLLLSLNHPMHIQTYIIIQSSVTEYECVLTRELTVLCPICQSLDLSGYKLNSWL